MNKIILRGVISNIGYSHSINSVDFYKAVLTTENNDIIPLCFKYASPYAEGEVVSLSGSLRSFSRKDPETGTSKVDIYIFTYFDLPEEQDINFFELDGRVCKKDRLRMTKDGKKRMHITLANNIFSTNSSQKLNNYIPIVAYEDLAEQLSSCEVNDKIKVTGYFHSRNYIKNNNGESEEKVAYEGVLSSLETI